MTHFHSREPEMRVAGHPIYTDVLFFMAVPYILYGLCCDALNVLYSAFFNKLQKLSSWS